MSSFFLSRYVRFILIAAIVFVGAFFRLYQHEDWLHFQLDQARDAEIVKASIQKGVEQLPLQGPRAAGTFLRLGPGFYYLEYASAWLFGDSPSGMAMFIAIFSILTIPLTYVFLHRYFTFWIAASLAAVVAVSPYFVLYGRFAWNPNILPFLTLFGLHALLRAVDENGKRKAFWFFCAAFSLGLATHMHFITLIVTGISVVAFLLYKRPKLSIFAWIFAFFAVALLYTPIVVNEYKTGGQNSQQFVEAVFGKSEKSNHNIAEKAVRMFSDSAVQYAIIMTGNERIELFGTSISGLTNMHVSCDKDCRDHVWVGMASLFVFILGSVLLVYFIWKEQNQVKKDMLVLTAIWFLVSSALFIPIAYSLVPRFFLGTVVVPLVLTALILEFTTKVRWGKYGGYVIAIFLVVSSGLFLSQGYSVLKNASSDNVSLSGPDRILRESYIVTLGQMRQIIGYMSGVRDGQHGYPIYIKSDSYYQRAFRYLIKEKGINSGVISVDTIYQKGVYFLILQTDSDIDSKIKKYMEKFTFEEEKDFGTLTVLRIIPKSEFVTAESENFGENSNDFSSVNNNSKQKRYIWEEVLNGEDDEGSNNE